MQGFSKPHSEALEPSLYQITVQGRLDESWSSWFDDMVVTIERDKNGITLTTLTGVVLDQPALYGLLSRIRDLGLLLMSVQRVNNNNPIPPLK